MSRIFLLFVIVSAVLFGQTAQVTGRITDQAGAVVPNASVTVSNTATGATRKIKSTHDGYYTAPLLQPGTYDFTVEMQGFKPIQQSGVQLRVDQVLRLDFSLLLGNLSEEVQVTSQ